MVSPSPNDSKILIRSLFLMCYAVYVVANLNLHMSVTIHMCILYISFMAIIYLISLTVILIKTRCYNRNMGFYLCTSVFTYGCLGIHIDIATGLTADWTAYYFLKKEISFCKMHHVNRIASMMFTS